MPNILPASGSVPDLLATLREIERLAKHADESIKNGSATTGASALTKIKHHAGDAVRRAVVADIPD